MKLVTYEKEIQLARYLQQALSLQLIVLWCMVVWTPLLTQDLRQPKGFKLDPVEVSK